jgi:hypothetical protein
VPEHGGGSGISKLNDTIGTEISVFLTLFKMKDRNPTNQSCKALQKYSVIFVVGNKTYGRGQKV